MKRIFSATKEETFDDDELVIGKKDRRLISELLAFYTGDSRYHKSVYGVEYEIMDGTEDI